MSVLQEEGGERMIEVKEERLGNGTSLFIEFEDGKKKTWYVAPSTEEKPKKQAKKKKK